MTILTLPALTRLRSTTASFLSLKTLLIILTVISIAQCSSNIKDRRTSVNGRRLRAPAGTSSVNKGTFPRYSQDYLPYERRNAHKNSNSGYQTRNSHSKSRSKNGGRSDKPNIVVILTDDQDVLLGSLNYMPKTEKLLRRQGVYFNNSFVPTPMCCPSRSTFLTGLYVHNHNVYTNNANCSSKEWQQRYETRNFATYLNKTHSTAYFGKYLNEYDGSHIPPGWHRWVGLIKNSRFYNYTLVDERGVFTKHGDNYYADYLTDVIANDGRAFLHDSKKRDPTKPVMMVLSVPAPHGPEDAAPQYQHMFVNNTDHRTPAWNYAPNPDKQWLLQRTNRMIPQYKLFTDLLQRRRLQTLQSVDDLVENVVHDLEMLGELDNTYIIYTSDHGYHLGQFGLIKGKAMPFDFDTRVPLIMRGPGIRPGTVISNIVSNIDIAPTLLDMAGQEIPEHMDGESMLRLLKATNTKKVDKQGFVDTKRPWRDTVLMERGKLTDKALKQRMRAEEKIILNQANSNKMNFYIPVRRKLAEECSKEESRLPCKPGQKWYCIEDNGRLRKHKCRNKSPNAIGDASMLKDQPFETFPCPCENRKNRKWARVERRRHRRFLKRHVSRNSKPKLWRSRNRRSTQPGNPTYLDSAVTGSFNGFDMFNRRCRILANQSVLCDLDIYKKAEEWKDHKERIDGMIKEYRKALEDLRDIRKHLEEQKPYEGLGGHFDGDEDESEEDFNENEDNANNCECDKDGNIITLAKKKRMENRHAERENRIIERETKIESREYRRHMRKQRRRRRKEKNKELCNTENMNCFTHDNGHWKTPPFWNSGPFCFCSNANNNTYWCLRTINQTHDFLYCEFITLFMSYYDLKTDPFQLENTVTKLNYGVLQQLHEKLKKLKDCQGSKDCYSRGSEGGRLSHDDHWAGLINLKRSSKQRYKDDNEEDEEGKPFDDAFSTDEIKDQENNGLAFDYE